MITFQEILRQKRGYYGYTEAAIACAAEEYAVEYHKDHNAIRAEEVPITTEEPVSNGRIIKKTNKRNGTGFDVKLI